MADLSILLYSSDPEFRAVVARAVGESAIPGLKLTDASALPTKTELLSVLAVVLDRGSVEMEKRITNLLEEDEGLSEVRVISPNDSSSIYHIRLPESSVALGHILQQLYRRRGHMNDLRTIVLSYENAVKELVASREKYRSFLEQSSEGIWRFEFPEPIPLSLPPEQLIEKAYMTGYLAECNEAMARFYGVDSIDDLIGKPLREVLPADDPTNQAMVRAFIESGFALRNAETHEPDAKGNIKIYLNNLVAQIEGDVVTRVWGTQRDVTAQRQAQADREELLKQATEAREQAEAANRMKDQFLATLSHELRTPLNAILGWTQLLNGTLETQDVEREELAEALEVIERNAKVQAQLIEDLLDISRIISGKMRLQLDQVNMKQVIEAAINTVEQAALAKEIRIRTTFPAEIRPLQGDQSRLQQVIWNLLSNAVKFTPRGGEIAVQLEFAEDKYDVVIRDSGQGIEPEFLPYVFDRFRQADATSTRKIGGLGLGLSIVRQLVEMHGGSVAVDSLGKGEGTIFIVSLPTKLEPAKRQDTTDRAASLAVDAERIRASLSGKKILVVDDEADARELLRRLLESVNATVSVASSADEAESILKAAAHDILISDISMPERDGFDLIRSIRLAHDHVQLPAIALTAYARTEDRTRTLEAGFQEHLPKPLNADALRAAIFSLVESRRQSSAEH